MLHDDRRTGDYLAALAAGGAAGRRCARHRHRERRACRRCRSSGCAARLRGRRQRHRGSGRARVRGQRRGRTVVTLVPGWSRQIELPEPADLLVAEVIGNEPLEEEILETTLDARRRLLKPDARLIPHTLTLLARPAAAARSGCTAAGDRAGSSRPLAVSHAWSSSRSWTPPFQAPSTCRPRRRRSRGGRPLGPTGRARCARPHDVHGGLGARLGRPRRRRARHRECRRRHVPGRAPTGRSEHVLDPWTWPTSSWATSVWVLPRPCRSRSRRQRCACTITGGR